MAKVPIATDNFNIDDKYSEKIECAKHISTRQSIILTNTLRTLLPVDDTPLAKAINNIRIIDMNIETSGKSIELFNDAIKQHEKYLKKDYEDREKAFSILKKEIDNYKLKNPDVKFDCDMSFDLLESMYIHHVITKIYHDAPK